MRKNSIAMSDYDKKVHRFGRISTIILILALIAVPLAMNLIWGIAIDVGATVKGFIGIFTMMFIIGIVEFFSYAPILGAGGTYLSFTTGNILNMKLPAAVSSVGISGFKNGSKEAEIISMIAVAVSSLVTMLILLIGMLFISAILPVIESPAIAPAFANFMPALLGALAVPLFIKEIKTAWVPSVIAAIATLVLGYALVSGYLPLLMPIFLAIAVLTKYVQYKKAKKAEVEKEEVG
ncbi:MAG: hypothetical protein AAGU74_13265 [Bacillota bacterium]